MSSPINLVIYGFFGGDICLYDENFVNNQH